MPKTVSMPMFHVLANSVGLPATIMIDTAVFLQYQATGYRSLNLVSIDFMDLNGSCRINHRGTILVCANADALGTEPLSQIKHIRELTGVVTKEICLIIRTIVCAHA